MSPPTVSGLHHITFPVSDLVAAISWYEQLLGAEHLTALDHYDPSGARFAAVLAVPGLDVPVQLRAGQPVAAPAGFEPVTFSVRDRADLDAWVAHLDALGVPHLPVTTAQVGESLQFVSPDGTPLRLYTGSVDLLREAIARGRGARRA